MRAPAYSTLIIALLITVAAVIFAFQNDGEIAIRFLNISGEESVAVVLLATFALGVVATTLALLPTLFKAIGQANAAKRRSKKLTKEVAESKEHAQKLVQEVARARGATEEAEKMAQTGRAGEKPKSK